jgi:hypothetical protein
MTPTPQSPLSPGEKTSLSPTQITKRIITRHEDPGETALRVERAPLFELPPPPKSSVR